MLWPNGTKNRPTVSSSFGPRKSPTAGASSNHMGVDLVGYSSVRAVAAGTVTAVGTPSGWSGGGTQVWVQHDGFLTRSMHLVAGSPAVRVGQHVDEGQHLGTMGRTGNVTGVHHHLEVVVNGKQIDPLPFITARLGGTPASTSTNAKVQLEQVFLASRGFDVGAADGIAGPKYRAAVKAYQTYLAGRGWYKGAIDGDWGPSTQAAHAIFYAEVTAPAPTTAYPVVSIGILGRIGDVRGLQKLARIGGYKGAIDNQWGPGSQAGFTAWLIRNQNGYVTGWLRSRWGYVGDDHMGPQMTAALQRANAENFKAL